ncbi:MAG: protein tyrosine phosphatase [Deltaproteobacteria bacterium]|nr:protein tyrosine phosphatase [Deltaproteobacteria bacterium]HCH65962.1 hypothetical protein [Deltaproteobacteria bacterium]
MSPRPHRLMFVCTANICRSPMAEGLARAEAARRGLPVEIRSGGILGLLDKPAAANAVRACREHGVDLSSHRSRGVTAADVAWADAVLVMELRHQRELHLRFPELDGRVVLLGTFGGRQEVDDPVGGWIWRFRRCRTLIIRSIEKFYDFLDPGGRAN